MEKYTEGDFRGPSKRDLDHLDEGDFIKIRFINKEDIWWAAHRGLEKHVMVNCTRQACGRASGAPQASFYRQDTSHFACTQCLNQL